MVVLCFDLVRNLLCSANQGVDVRCACILICHLGSSPSEDKHTHLCLVSN